MMRRMLPPALMLALTLFGASVWGHHSGIPYADWMMSLTRPDYPMSSCCGMADQYYVREYGPSQRNSVAFAAVVIGIEGEPGFWSRSRGRRSFGTALTRRGAGSSLFRTAGAVARCSASCLGWGCELSDARGKPVVSIRWAAS